MPTTDTLKAFRKSQPNIWFLLYSAFYFCGFALRMNFVMQTPDVVYAPSLVDDKFSTEPLSVLQNGNIQFVECSGECLIRSSPSTSPFLKNATNLHSLVDLQLYYSSLYRFITNETIKQFELREFNSPRAFWNIEGDFFFTFPPKNGEFNTKEWYYTTIII